MKYKDPLQYNQSVAKSKMSGMAVALILVSILAFVEGVFLLVIALNPKEQKNPTTELTTQVPVTTGEIIATPEEPVTETETTTEVTTEEIITEAPVTEAPINELTTREYYYLFNGYLEKYNAHALSEAINTAYLPELREIILTQTLQSVNAPDETEYWNILTAQYGGAFACSFNPTEELVLDEETLNALRTQLADYGYAGTVEQAVSVQVTRTTVISETGQPCAEAYNRYVIVKTDSGWWIVGKQAQGGEPQ